MTKDQIDYQIKIQNRFVTLETFTCNCVACSPLNRYQ